MQGSPPGGGGLGSTSAESLNPPFTNLDWTTHEFLEERPDVTALLTVGAFDVHAELMLYAAETAFTVGFVLDVHRTMFERVWPDYAGALRGYGPGRWPYAADIGGIGYGSPPERVDADLQRIVWEAQRYPDSLDAVRDTLPRDELRAAALQVGAWLHCEVDRIHPFVNGNGRTSRAMTHYVLARYGFPPLDWDRACRRDYYAAFRLFYREGILDDFVRFVHRVQFLQDTGQVQLLGGTDDEYVDESICSPAEARERERIQRQRRRSAL